MRTHEQTIESHIDSNVSAAINQSHEYGGIEKAFESFLQNFRDSCEEDGYTPEEAFEASFGFVVEFNKRTGLSL